MVLLQATIQIKHPQKKKTNKPTVWFFQKLWCMQFLEAEQN